MLQVFGLFLQCHTNDRSCDASLCAKIRPSSGATFSRSDPVASNCSGWRLHPCLNPVFLELHRANLVKRRVCYFLTYTRAWPSRQQLRTKALSSRTSSQVNTNCQSKSVSEASTQSGKRGGSICCAERRYDHVITCNCGKCFGANDTGSGKVDLRHLREEPETQSKQHQVELKHAPSWQLRSGVEGDVVGTLVWEDRAKSIETLASLSKKICTSDFENIVQHGSHLPVWMIDSLSRQIHA